MRAIVATPTAARRAAVGKLRKALLLTASRINAAPGERRAGSVVEGGASKASVKLAGHKSS